MTKRLTDKQKEEIVKDFKSGITIDDLSQKYTFTNPTIIRYLKKNLGELLYKELLNKSKSLRGKSKSNEKKTTDLNELNFVNESLKYDSKILNEKILPQILLQLILFLKLLL